jgi:hypothetical protein
MESEPIDISTLDKGSVLAALYNASRPLGMGFMQYDPKPMQPEEATELLKRSTYFDYLKGRVMKVNLRGSTLDPALYDRDNGDGAAKRAIEALRASGVNGPKIASAHQDGKRQAAASARAGLAKPSVMTTKSGLPVMEMGLADVADALGPKINQATDHENQ